jgi:hypothetical protein
MKPRFLLAGAALFLSTIAIGNAKTWDVMMDSPTKAGNLLLPKGNYSVKLDKSNQAIFTAADSGKKYATTVKIQNAPQKFEATQVESTKRGDQEVIQSIDLGGTNEMLQFGE